MRVRESEGDSDGLELAGSRRPGGAAERRFTERENENKVSGYLIYLRLKLLPWRQMIGCGHC